jgi:hypothetical protein
VEKSFIYYKRLQILIILDEPKLFKMKKLLILSSLFSLLAAHTMAQGCIAIRNLTGFGQFAQLGYKETNSKWMMGIDNRIFGAHTFLEGRKDITPAHISDGGAFREYTMNIDLSRILDHGWAISLDMPISNNTQAGKGLNTAGVYSTGHAYGVGDIRFTVYKWLFNTDVAKKGNIQLGLGIKLPTGNYHTEDYYYTDPNDISFKELGNVNVAIQLGDGGTGIATQLNSFYVFNHSISLYGNFFYLISPKDQNATATWPPNFLPPNVATLWHTVTKDVNSVPDNYTIRGGANFTFGRFVATAGLHYEGVPAHDLIGQNDGFRTAGHIFSAEPGIQYKFKKSFLYSFVTVPIDRASIQTVPDKREEAITGVPTLSPGHFANYLVFIGYSFTF